MSTLLLKRRTEEADHRSGGLEHSYLLQLGLRLTYRLRNRLHLLRTPRNCPNHQQRRLSYSTTSGSSNRLACWG